MLRPFRFPALLFSALLACGSLLVLPGCSELLASENDALPSTEDGTLTLVNRADRPFAVVVANAEDMPLIDPMPALPADSFEEKKIAVGAYRRLDFGNGFDRGKALYLLIYAPCDCDLSEQIINVDGPGAAPQQGTRRLSVEELEERDYRIVIETTTGYETP